MAFRPPAHGFIREPERPNVRGPVSRVLFRTRYPVAGTGRAVAAIHLGDPLPDTLLQPTRILWGEAPCPLAGARDPYSALLRVGFAMRAALPKPRCALAAPFHPCLCPLPGHRRFALCGTFPWPWPEGRRPAGVTRHPCFVEPGLSSRRKDTQLPGPLTAGEIGASHDFAKQKRCWTKVGDVSDKSDDMEHMEHGTEEKNAEEE